MTIEEVKEELSTAIEMSLFELAKLPFVEDPNKEETKIVFRERVMAFCIFGINCGLVTTEDANKYKERLDFLLK